MNMNLTNSIVGERANSRRSNIQVYLFQRNKPVRVSNVKESTKELAQYIPFWPNVIKINDLVKKTGLTRNQIEVRMSSCHGEYLIFTVEKGALSRLKEDLSNV